MSKQQGGSILAILLGVALLFGASTNRIGAAVAALRGGNSPASTTKTDDVATTPDDVNTHDKGSAGGGELAGNSYGMHFTGRIIPGENGAVRNVA